MNIFISTTYSLNSKPLILHTFSSIYFYFPSMISSSFHHFILICITLFHFSFLCYQFHPLSPYFYFYFNFPRVLEYFFLRPRYGNGHLGTHRRKTRGEGGSTLTTVMEGRDSTAFTWRDGAQRTRAATGGPRCRTPGGGREGRGVRPRFARWSAPRPSQARALHGWSATPDHSRGASSIGTALHSPCPGWIRW